MFVRKSTLADQQRMTAFYQGLLKQTQAILDKEFALNEEQRAALRSILAQKTEGANATVTRMAKIAAEALGEA